MKLKNRYIAGLVALVASGIVGVIAYTTVWQWVFLSMLFCLGGVVGIVLVLIALVLRRQAGTEAAPRANKTSTVLLLAGVFLLITATYYPIVRGIRNAEVTRAQNFTTGLIPRLEAYADQNGAYPDSVDAVLTGNERVPRLLHLSDDIPLRYDNRRYYYAQQGESYGFRFYMPDGFIGVHYEYCCGVDGEWTIID